MQFERMASRCGWSMLIPLLRGKALTFFSTLPITTREHYPHLKQKMDARFGNTDPQTMVIHLLNLLRQSEEESLDEFLEKTYRVALDGLSEAPDSTVETLTIEVFLNGVLNQQAAVHVRNREPRTVEEALRLKKVHAQNFGGGRGVSKACRQVTFEEPAGL